MPNYRQLLETASSYLPTSWLGWAATIGTTLFATVGVPIIHDLYQRYKSYVLPADRSASFLREGGIHGLTNNSDINIEQHFDTFRQINDLRNQRQDTVRANLSPLGRLLSRYLREGHSDIDALIARNLAIIAPGRDHVTSEEFELALQQAIMGGTRTRGSLTYFARKIGEPIYNLIG
ncbi:hypothetical protein [Chryseobacterium paridis]|uniref:Uncharacterized protein n=1 Tax=Chryseobacterium paridis TaxID=2800328 RepID=A0ABS1FY42_9FLAO|nr:hypothetical protein [Chryseobacterium paridis]MBK1897339.1 hypothetical protein [Chryseobacterium paridis]